jgi:tripeptide aminopeptidase
MTNDLLRRVLEQQSASGRTEKITNFIAKELRAIDPDIVIRRKKGNLYAVKGQAEVYPCIVAHTDTVHQIIPDKEYQVYCDSSGTWFAWDSARRQQTGIGGDDKVGIYIALALVARLENVKVAFFRDEEIGCQGAAQANMQFFRDCAFVLECDRRGYGDFVNEAGWTELHDEEFADAVAPILTEYGFKPSSGMMTDVQELKDNGLKVAAANMSCGYYRPHTAGEYVVQEEVEAVESMVYAICFTMGDRQWLHDKPKSMVSSYRSGRWDYDSDWTNGTGRYATHYDKQSGTYVSRCEACNIFQSGVKWRKEHRAMECEECFKKVEDILNEAERRESGGSSLALSPKDVVQKPLMSVEEWNLSVLLDADIARIRRVGATDNDFLWAVDEDNDMWPDDFKMEVIQMYYEQGGMPVNAGEELLA